MAATSTVSNHAKYQMSLKLIDLVNDSIKVLLMRSGFTFNKDNHAKLVNLKATTGAIDTLAINASKELTDSGSGFVTAGFVPGNSVTMSGFTEGGNNVTKIISTVAAGTIVFTSTTGLVEEAAGDTVTVVANDELATAFGYTQDTKVLTSQAIVEDDANNWAQMTCDPVSWTASGGSIGPTPGAILYDDTTTDNTILGYLDFGAEQEATTGIQLIIQSIKIRI